MPSFSLGICGKALIFSNAGPEVSSAATATPSPCPFALQGSLPVTVEGTTSSHSPALLGCALGAAAWAHPELVTTGISCMFLHRKQCLSCWFLFAGSGLSVCFRKKCAQASVSFCLSKDTHGERRMHTRACEQIPACVSVSLSHFLHHCCEELHCLTVLKGSSISPVKFWKFRGE